MATAGDDSIGAARQLVADALGRSLNEIPSDGSIHTIAAWDSIGHIRVVLALEAVIGRPLPSAAIATLASVADVAAEMDKNT
jgi:acyl carrier protein